jgi:hypothetical protein
MRSQRRPRRMALSQGADQMNLPVRAAFDRIEADVIALCRVHRATVHMARTSRCQPAHDALAKCDPHPGLLGKACNEHLRPSLGSGHSGATLGAMFTRTNAAAARAGQCDARPRRGLTPYRPAQRFTCSSHPLWSPWPDWDISAPAKRRCRRPRYITPNLLPATVAPW